MSRAAVPVAADRDAPAVRVGVAAAFPRADATGADASVVDWSDDKTTLRDAVVLAVATLSASDDFAVAAVRDTVRAAVVRGMFASDASIDGITRDAVAPNAGAAIISAIKHVANLFILFINYNIK